MNILMVMPKMADGGFFPIGIAYISSFLKKKGYNIFCLNLSSHEESEYEVLKQYIRKHNIKIVCTGGISILYKNLKVIVDVVKSIDPNIIIVMGGGCLSSNPELILNTLRIDYGVIGEGEYTAAELVDAIINKKDFSRVKGIIFKDEKGDIVRTQPRPEIEDIDSLPYPDYDGFNVEKYLERRLPATDFERALGHDNPRMIDMVSSRSCPFSCTFCFHTSGKKYRQRSLESFFKEAEYVIQKYDANIIALNDELFSVNSDRMLKFAEMAKKYKIKWMAQIKVNPPVGVDLLKQLKDSGMIYISFGLESVNNIILRSMKKKITSEQINSALRTAYDARICFGGNFLLGDPAETVKTANDTIRWWANYPELNTNLGVGNRIITFPGTPIYQQAVNKGVIKDEVKYLEDGCPVVNVSKNMTDDDYLYLKCRLYKIKENLKYLSVGEVLYSKKTGNLNGRNIYHLKIGNYKRFDTSIIILTGVYET
jgi:radical SAM superfamily enzyme YgiQ (UPF0313 family)